MKMRKPIQELQEFRSCRIESCHADEKRYLECALLDSATPATPELL
jgi:hypothetical protein